MLISTPSTTLQKRLLTEEHQLETAKASREAAEQRLIDLRTKHRDLLNDEVVYTKLAEATDLGTRMRLREEIRKKVTHIELTFDPPYKHPYGVANYANALITFVNGAKRAMAFASGGAFLTVVGEPLPDKAVPVELEDFEDPGLVGSGAQEEKTQ